MNVQSGDSIVVVILQTIRQLEHDGLSTFQLRLHGHDDSPPVSATDLIVQEHECQSFQTSRSAAQPIPTPADLATQHSFVQEFWPIWVQFAAAWEDEPLTCDVAVWFVDHHRRVPHGQHHRIAHLTGDYTTWLTTLEHTWADQRIPDTILTFTLVQPAPPPSAQQVCAHVILVQRPDSSLCTSLVTLAFQSEEPVDEDTHQAAITTPLLIRLADILSFMEFLDLCLGDEPSHICIAWHQDLQLTPGLPLPSRTGYGITGRVVPLPSLGTEGTVLLQLAVSIHRSSSAQERLTGVSVAHEHRPCDSIELHSHIDDLLSQTILVRVWTLPTAQSLQPPDYIELPSGFTVADASTELSCWGFHGTVFLCGSHESLVFRPASLQHDHFYFYCNRDPASSTGVILREGTPDADDLPHMGFLHSQGFTKAIILCREPLDSHMTCLHFQDVQPQLESSDGPRRQRSEWVARQSLSQRSDPVFTVPIDSAKPACIIPVDLEGIIQFFSSGQLPLHTNIEGFELPQFIIEAIQACRPVKRVDRYVIYTDGSSQTRHRHRPPLWVEEFDTSDTWSFAVFKEQYHDDAGPTSTPWLEFVGFTCQPVLYDASHPHYIGTSHTGSDAAETEALFWSALWRIAQNDRVPMAFVCDSQLAGGQATGCLDSGTLSSPFRCLRAAFQALEAFLPPDQLCVAHTRSHAGDPYNELVDHFAKLEGRTSLYLPRQAVDMQSFQHTLFHLWMILSEAQDLPAFTPHGFDIGAPALPSCETALEAPQNTDHSSCRLLSHTLSAGSANVRTFYTGEDRTPGKLAYVRDQFRAHGLLFLGLQETRTARGSSQVDGVLRLSGGDLNGHHGVELWTNLNQPIAQHSGDSIYLQARHFVVVHADPRLLFVRLEHPHLRLWLIVAYAPQSGIDLSTRDQWWQSFSDLYASHVGQGQAIVMIDANAATGPQDDVHVFSQDDHSSPNTVFFRRFLTDHSLCVPASSDIHQGSQTTWLSPLDASEHRIDYVLIPCAWISSCTFSSTLPDLDIVTVGDHTGVAIELTWQSFDHLASSCDRSRPSFDRQRVGQVSLRDDAQIQALHQLPWHTNIETQIQHFNEAFTGALQRSCKLGPQRPKKPFITDDIWSIRSHKLRNGRAMRELRRRQRRELLAHIFQVWRTPDEPPDTQFAVSLLCRSLHVGVRQHRLHHQLRLALRNARRAALKRAIDDLPAGCDSAQVLHQLRPIIGSTNLKHCKAAPLPLINDEHGQPCQTPEAARDRWISFFGAMEGGVRMSPGQLRAIWLQNLAEFTCDQVTIPASEVPTLTDLEHAFRRVRPGKAVGTDHIPPELCHFHPQMMARAGFTQVLKLLAHGHEALQHKGGLLVAAWKKKASQSECSSYRSLLISSHVSKTVHRAVKDRQSHLYEAYLHRSQVGGRKKVPVNIGLHHVRASARRARRRGHSNSLVFLDLQEAFYRIVRQLAVGGPVNDQALAQLAARLRLPDHTLHELHVLLDQDPATAQAGLPPYLQRTLRALHTDTHFHIHGQEDYVRTTHGSRPGDPFADTIFGYLFARLLQCVERQLLEYDLVEKFPDAEHSGLFPATLPCSETTILGPTWMDDLCLTLSASCPLELERQTGITCGILLDACAAHGVSPNLKKGKTEVLFAFRGRGSRALRTKYFGPTSSSTLQVITENDVQQISVVGTYIHLGGLAHHTSDTRHDMRKRLAVGHAAFTQHRRTLFQNRQLSLQKRCELFQSLVLSKIVYGMESWALLDRSSRLYFHSAVMRLYRRLLRLPSDHHASDDEILASVWLPAPLCLLRINRLRYLGLLYHCEHVTPRWPVLQADDEWAALIRSDLQWLWDLVASTVKLRHPLEHFQDWEYIFRYHRTYWKTILRRAAHLDQLHTRDRFALLRMHRQIFTSLTTSGTLATTPTEIDDGPLDDEAVFGCMLCGCRTKTRGGEGAHLFRKHGIVARERWLYDSTSCPCCLREYHTFAKLQSHLRRSQACREHARGQARFHYPAPGKGSQINEMLHRQHDGLVPVQQAQGPHDARLRPQADDDHRVLLFEALALLVFDHIDHPDQDLFALMQHKIREFAIGWTETKQTLRHLFVFFSDADLAAADITSVQWKRLQARLCDASSWPFLVASVVKEQADHLQDLAAYEAWCSDLLQEPHPYRPGVRCPRLRFRERIVVHAFSGRRRPGDLQWFLEKFASDRDIMHLAVVSLDLVIDPVWGDLGKQETYDFWLSSIRSGFIVGFLCGPPCCTWSVARGKHIPTHRGSAPMGPRIIRTASDLWGLQSLSLKEKRQIVDGNFLLGFCLIALTLLHATGGAGILEHPSEPDDEAAASIWRLPLVQLLMTLPGVDSFQLAQGLLGAASVKGTRLLTINLPGLPKSIRRFALCKDLPKGQSIGLTSEGAFRTSFLKEYPPAFCGALADGFTNFLAQLPEGRQPLPAIVLQKFQGMVSHDMGTTIGKDYARG
eukprot:s1235_g15.t1